MSYGVTVDLERPQGGPKDLGTHFSWELEWGIQLGQEIRPFGVSPRSPRNSLIHKPNTSPSRNLSDLSKVS